MIIKPVVIRFWNGSRHILSEISERQVEAGSVQAVDSRGMLEVMRKMFDATELVAELTGQIK